MPDNAKNTYGGYEKNSWKGNINGQTPGTVAGSAYKNNRGTLLPKFNAAGNPVTYKEFDVNNKISGSARDAERFVVGSDGSIYYTNDHYTTFTIIN